MTDCHPPGGRFAREHSMDLQVDAVRMGWLPFYPQFNRNPIQLVREAEEAGAHTTPEIADWVVNQLAGAKVSLLGRRTRRSGKLASRVAHLARQCLHGSAKGHEYFLRHYLGTHSNAIAEEVAQETVEEVECREAAPQGKMDLVVDLNFRMDTSALYSDIILPAASWYEKNDLNTTDLHSSSIRWARRCRRAGNRGATGTFSGRSRRRSASWRRAHFPEPFRDIVATPLLHDTPDEIAQPEVAGLDQGECEPVPGKTMPHLTVVERDYVNLLHRFISLGPGVKEHGVEDHGIDMDVEDLYDEFAKTVPTYEWNGQRYPSLEDAVDAANVRALLCARDQRRGGLSRLQGTERTGRPAARRSGGERPRRPV